MVGHLSFPNCVDQEVMTFIDIQIMEQQRYLDWLLLTTAPSVRSWVGDEVLLDSLGGDLSRTIELRMESSEWVQKYIRGCPSDGAVAEDYHMRELQLPGDLSILAGIHFCGSLNLFPFVGIYAQSREIPQEELRSVAEYLMGEFALFKPASVQFWTLGRAVDFEGAVRVKITDDIRFVIGNLAEMMASDGPSESLTLKKLVGLGCYQSYCETYKEFFIDHPQWRGLLEVESRESLEECAEHGGLFQVLIDGEFAGLIAAKPDRYRGVPGWLMIDEILTKANRGRGLAASMQRKFLEQLDQEKSSLVMGTIMADNQASYRTALRNSRVDAGGWIWVAPS